MKMNELAFIIIQYPTSYIVTGIWFSTILPYLAPAWIKPYRSYDVVRVVDYLTKGSFYYISTYILFFLLLGYYTCRKPDDMFPFWFSIQSWVGILCMETALQVSGKRKINFQKSAYWAGSYVASLIVQTLREGAVCFGLPAVVVQGILHSDGDTSLYWCCVASGIIDWVGLIHLLLNVKQRRPRTLGSTDVTARRSILDTIAYRFVEWYVIYYVYNLYPETFYEMRYWIFWVTVYRSLQLGIFFGVGTYFGQTWIDRGPNVYCADTWALNILGLAFRVFESTLSGYPKTIVLTVMFQKWLAKA